MSVWQQCLPLRGVTLSPKPPQAGRGHGEWGRGEIKEEPALASLTDSGRESQGPSSPAESRHRLSSMCAYTYECMRGHVIV